ncbi:nitrate- and nitrite sensing domain-containing protein [Streptomyces mangrovisoli]|uniref:histidine kinase n=1 Tax=Streptomyces mangrovisoli TaxID=1428628 RepID=A0A1J4NVT5_9ACTN|nr:nitrate- and nitrite sensing domain-containing protein [Streptomyces mangrovisoli]OIJ65620.1 histidine kinase [Streptomyces mangrovisoli]
MRFRGKSIRRKIVALLLVPLVSLTAIWGFATVLTGRGVARLFHMSSVVEKIGYPTEDTVRALQQERRQTLVYLADPRASDALIALRRTRTATDDAIGRTRHNVNEPGVRDSLDTDDGEHLTAVLDALDGISSLRRGVEQGTVDRAQAFDLYNRLVDPCYNLLATLGGIDDVSMDQQARALVNITRARELLSREDALLGSSLVVGTVTRSESRQVSDLIAQRTLMYDISEPLLPAEERDRFDRFWSNATTAPLRTAERAAVATESGMPHGVTAQEWDATAGSVLRKLTALDDQVGDRYQDRIRPVAIGVIVEAAVVGVLGLVAVLLSLVLSVRVGRSLIRDLRQLRLEAHEASGVRLPSVMRRLSTGEQVDVETEVPRLEYDRNEIGEVGQALNTLQRAAVEAAVKQSELRSGVSEVFVNLARRSQVLLHKQLTLLDTMERRTEDTAELADLFRLDHLTTRMRRHAEGLVILSGAAPSRQWRRPIQLMDVVRAAVAEVEDYERIEVRRLPRVAVTGPAVADVTHLVAELLENATVFSPPHTAVQVLGERVANGFTLEIHDRGLGMTAEALLDNNLRLAETPEFELSDTDRLGLFVVSRLAQRQNVRVSLQPSPYGGTTAVVFLPDVLLTDDVPDTNGIGFRLDRERSPKEAEAAENRRAPLSRTTAELPGLSPALFDGPVELEAPVDLDALEAMDDFPGALDDSDSERGGLFRPRRSVAQTDDENTIRAVDRHEDGGLPDGVGESGAEDPVGASLPRRRTPKLVSSHGRPVGDPRSRRPETDDRLPGGPRSRAETEAVAPLPSRRRGESPLGRATARPDRPTERPGSLPDVRAERPGASPDVRAERTGRPPTDRGTTGPSTDRGATGPLTDRGTGGPGKDRAAERPGPLTDRRAERPGSAHGPAEAPEAPALPGRVRRPALGTGGTGRTASSDGPAPGEPAGTAALPKRVRQASLAPQLKQDPDRRTERSVVAEIADRDADQVRSRMASLQRGWQRGREENAAGDGARGDTAQGTTEGDGR